jgi:hypothetical protein
MDILYYLNNEGVIIMKLKLLSSIGIALSFLSLCSCKDNNVYYEEKNGIVYILMEDNTYRVKMMNDYKTDTFVVPTTFLKKDVTAIGDQGCYKHKELKKVVLHDGINKIFKNAFWGSGLEEIDILPSVITIGDSAFYDCDSLTEITIPGSVLSLGKDLFQNCDNLVSIHLSNNLTSIPWGMFDGCTSLDYTIGSNIVTISGYAFRKTAVKNLVIPSNVKNIQDCAYKQCPNLETIVIEEGLESIGKEVFSGCSNLKSVTLPSTLMSVAPGAFYGNALTITYNGTKDKFNTLNVDLTIGSTITCTDGIITI